MGPTYGPYALVLEEGAPGGLSGECGRARAHGTNLQRRAEAERLVQCVNALHEVGTTGFVHCDIKPAHFLRFGASRRCEHVLCISISTLPQNTGAPGTARGRGP